MRDKKKILVIDDDALIASMLSKFLKNKGYEVRTETATFEPIPLLIESWAPDVVLLDIFLPGRNGIELLEDLNGLTNSTQVIMLTADHSAESAVKCLKLGAVDYLTKPFHLDEVEIVVQNAIEKEGMKKEIKYLRKVYAELFNKEIIGESNAMQQLRANVEKISRVRVPNILITGESGTGKELVARTIHKILNEAGLGGTPFMAVNCTALPEHLLESELFGYDKGAFTDAKVDKKGIFELADGGTILLDEIGDMKPHLQGKLLRVLEERSIRRIGGVREIPIDVTVIATSNRDLGEAMERGEFRLDLFHRLNTFSLSVPPLRQRREDVPVLAKYFLAHFADKYRNKMVRDISPDVAKILCAYDWPGNVRELRNVIERIVVLESSEIIMPWHLPQEVAVQSAKPERRPNFKFNLPDAGLSLEELEKDLIRQALEKTGFNKTLAAKRLNISYDSLRYQVKKFGLEP
jgi:DNA-binding NtrC family response regulator